jgi:hypothetical protein
LISLMYLITYLDRVNISTVAPVISKELHKVGGALLRRPRRTPLRRDG